MDLNKPVLASESSGTWAQSPGASPVQSPEHTGAADTTAGHPVGPSLQCPQAWASGFLFFPLSEAQ